MKSEGNITSLLKFGGMSSYFCLSKYFQSLKSNLCLIVLYWDGEGF